MWRMGLVAMQLVDWYESNALYAANLKLEGKSVGADNDGLGGEDPVVAEDPDTAASFRCCESWWVRKVLISGVKPL